MRIHLLSVGRRMPRWVQEGYHEYARRLPPDCALELVEIDPATRPKGPLSAATTARICQDEGARLLKAVPKDALVVALDVRGQSWSTRRLATELTGWMAGGRDTALLVGGPDGLAAQCLDNAAVHWSLSALTFPHPLVRVVLAEQIYRAWSITRGHPYHRG